MPDSNILLVQDEIITSMAPLPWPITLYQTIDSTHRRMSASKTLTLPHVFLAEEQSEGCGQQDRHWHSPFAKNIYLSLGYTFQKKPSELSGLSLAIGLTLFEALDLGRFGGRAQLKWPNDVWVDQKKLAGILIDLEKEKSLNCRAVISMGVNINLITADPKLDQPWTSLRLLTGEEQNRNIWVAKILKVLHRNLLQFEEQSFQSFLSQWQEHDALFGQAIQLGNLNEDIQGVVMGVNEQGHLKLKLKDGSLKTFSAGKVIYTRR